MWNNQLKQYYYDYTTDHMIPNEHLVLFCIGTAVLGMFVGIFTVKLYRHFHHRMTRFATPKKGNNKGKSSTLQPLGSSKQSTPFEFDPTTGNDFQREGLISRLMEIEPNVADSPDKNNSSSSSTPQHDATTKEVVDMLAGLSVDGGVSPEAIQRLGQLSHQLTEGQLQAIKSSASVDDQDLQTYMFLHTLRTTTSKEMFTASIPGINQSVMSDVEKEMSEKVAKTMKKAFWAMFTQELEKTPPNLKIIVERLQEFVDRMISFVQKKPSVVTDRIDIALIKQQIEKQVFDREGLTAVCNTIVGTLELMESEFQHDITKQWNVEFPAKVNDATNKFSDLATEAFRFLFERLDQLEADVKNYKASLAVPEQRRKWERDHFEMMILKKQFSLERVGKVIKQYQEGEREHPALTLRRAICTLVSGDSPIEWIDLPEMMRFDPPALHLLQNRFQSCLLLAIFALNFNAHLPQSNKDKVAEFFHSVADFMLSADVNKQSLIEHVETQYTIAMGGKIDEGQLQGVDKMMEQVLKCVTPDQASQQMPPLYSLFKKKLVAGLNLGARGTRIPTNALGEKPWTLCYSVEKAQSISDDLSTFIMEHIKVYDAAYKQVVFGQPGASSSAAK